MNKRTKFLNEEIKKIEKVMEILPFRFEILKVGKKDIREGVRQEYDRIKELVDAAIVRLAIENKKEKKETAVIDNFTKMKEKYEIDMKNMENQMKELDKEIEEVDATLNLKVEAARSYIQLVKKLLKK